MEKTAVAVGVVSGELLFLVQNCNASRWLTEQLRPGEREAVQ